MAARGIVSTAPQIAYITKVPSPNGDEAGDATSSGTGVRRGVVCGADLPDSTERASVQVGVSMHDVAALAGVSTATVSNTLNHPEKVSFAQREKARMAMATLGYVRNESARRLKSRRSREICMVVPRIESFFQDIAKAADEAGAAITLCSSFGMAGRGHATFGGSCNSGFRGSGWIPWIGTASPPRSCVRLASPWFSSLNPCRRLIVVRCRPTVSRAAVWPDVTWSRSGIGHSLSWTSCITSGYWVSRGDRQPGAGGPGNGLSWSG